MKPNVVLLILGAIAGTAALIGLATTWPGSQDDAQPMDSSSGQGEACAADFAVIGDYGSAGPDEAAVAELVHGWRPDFVVTTGDNNYPHGATETIEANIGQYWGRYIAENRFFPSLGNHDWEAAGARPYREYFTLPGNERYYDVAWGPVHLFVIDSDPSEFDGITATSRQARWLQKTMTASELPWQIVVMHHPPYSSSSNHGSHPALQWPFGEWGADAVLAGHDHVYERLEAGGVTFLVNGLGGNERYGFGRPLPQSNVRFQADFGALKAEASEEQLIFSFSTAQGELVDSVTLSNPRAGARCGSVPAE